MGKQENLIKVHFKGTECVEHLWAKPKKNNTAELRNIPFQGEFSLGDIVSLSPDLHITGIVKKKSRRASIEYSFKPTTLQKDWKKLVKYFEKNKVRVEGTTAGFASLAMPMSMYPEKMEKILEKSPVMITEFYIN